MNAASFLLMGYLLGLGMFQTADACSTSAIAKSKNKIVMKSYDWSEEIGYVMVNPREVEKISMLMVKGTPHSWVSKYGNVTFNQFGQELPNGGMNEKGLVVEIMWLASAKYPEQSTRPSTNESQWIQYQLDVSASVEDAIAHAKEIDVLGHFAPVHYMICDRSGECASFDYIDGKLEVHSGSQMDGGDTKINVLTNSTYAQSREALKSFEGFGGVLGFPNDLKSLPRFVRGAKTLQDFCADCVSDEVSFGFDYLDLLKQGTFTKWQIVYNPRELRIHFRSLTYPRIKSLSFENLDLTCSQLRLATRLDQEFSRSNIEADLSEFSVLDNYELLKQASQSLDHDLDDASLKNIAKFPSLGTKCVE